VRHQVHVQFSGVREPEYGRVESGVDRRLAQHRDPTTGAELSEGRRVGPAYRHWLRGINCSGGCLADRQQLRSEQRGLVDKAIALAGHQQVRQTDWSADRDSAATVIGGIITHDNCAAHRVPLGGRFNCAWQWQHPQVDGKVSVVVCQQGRQRHCRLRLRLRRRRIDIHVETGEQRREELINGGGQQDRADEFD
jgi:hypothetical protein